METFTGKSEKINGVWYPVSIKANNLKEAIASLFKGQKKSYGVVEAVKGKFKRDK